MKDFAHGSLQLRKARKPQRLGPIRKGDNDKTNQGRNGDNEAQFATCRPLQKLCRHPARALREHRSKLQQSHTAECRDRLGMTRERTPPTVWTLSQEFSAQECRTNLLASSELDIIFCFLIQGQSL